MLTRRSRSFQNWNYTTACCFKFKTHCEYCPNRVVCKLYSDSSSNPYKIHPIKYAMLMTYSNIGTEGLNDALIRGYKRIEEEEKALCKLDNFLMLERIEK